MYSSNKRKYEISILNTDIVFFCEEGESILKGMGRSGQRGIPSGCHGGGCGICKVRIKTGPYVSGKMNRAVISDLEEKSGYALACKALPQSDLVLEVVGKMRKSYYGTS